MQFFLPPSHTSKSLMPLSVELLVFVKTVQRRPKCVTVGTPTTFIIIDFRPIIGKYFGINIRVEMRAKDVKPNKELPISCLHHESQSGWFI